jgi:hypothetical protein
MTQHQRYWRDVAVVMASDAKEDSQIQQVSETEGKIGDAALDEVRELFKERLSPGGNWVSDEEVSTIDGIRSRVASSTINMRPSGTMSPAPHVIMPMSNERSA